jgi:hypothetical protein
MPDRMRCYNKACRMFDVTRGRCPSCQKISVIPYGTGTLCINRSCPDHASTVTDCFFCGGKHGQKSFLGHPDVMACTKGDCEFLLRRVETCDICGKLSWVDDEGMCRNPECEIAGKKVERCPACSLKTLARDSKGGARCLNAKCGHRGEAVESLDQTLKSGPKLPAADPETTEATTEPPDPPVPAVVTARPAFKAVLPDPPAPRTPARPTAVKPLAPAPPPPVVPPPARPPLRSAPAAIEEAYDLLRSTLLQGEGKRSPLYLIIGLPGSGKTVYLTLMGAMLGFRSPRFSFPYEGVEPNWVKVEKLVARHRASTDPRRLERISARIRDLVFDFGQERYESFLAAGQWPPATAHEEEEDDARPATYFLVSEILRNMKTAADVVTLETSGEHYQEVLRNFQKYAQGAQPANATQRVLVDMMNAADGFIVLVDPDNRDNDTIFKNFFMVLKDGLRPRALNAFYNELRQSVGGPPGGAHAAEKAGDVRRLIQLIREDEQRRQRLETQFADERRALADRLAEIDRKLEAGRHEILVGEDGKWLNGMEQALAKLEPDLVRSAKEKLLPEGAEVSASQLKERILLYSRGLIRVCTDRLDRIVRGKLEPARPAQDRSATLEIKKRYDLSDSFKIEVDESSFQEREVTHFKNLKFLSMVITKSDKYPIIHPPDQYAKRKLPGCEIHLRDIQDYLKLCGGQARYYNASATGYTLLSGGAHLPGPAHTHTPINILEPLFDLLNITE